MKIFRKIGDKFFYRGGIFHPTKNHSPYLRGFCQLKNKKIINIGAGGYDPIPGAINIDPYRMGPNTVKAFGENLPFDDNSIDLAICTATLEHIKSPQSVITEIHRVLKPEGEIYIEVPFIQPYHAAPNDYYRFTLRGSEEICKKFKKIDSGIVSGPGSGVAWILVEYAQLYFDNKFLKKIMKNLAKILVFPLKYIDNWLIKKTDSVILASGFYYYGKK
ncbi:MAG: class I SAM-dependent methyltransferase [Nanoarchaeota archaeon]|nr:class I SAM-dependent methyltransferase [Nanoarchaeota archaeon]